MKNKSKQTNKKIESEEDAYFDEDTKEWIDFAMPVDSVFESEE